MTSGGQCVMTTGTAIMLLWFASNWDMHTLGVSYEIYLFQNLSTAFVTQTILTKLKNSFYLFF